MHPLTILFLVCINGAILLAVVLAGINIAISGRFKAKDDHWKACEAYIEDISLLVDQYCENRNYRETRFFDHKMHLIFSKLQKRMQYLDKWQCREIHDLRDELIKQSSKPGPDDSEILVLEK